MLRSSSLTTSISTSALSSSFPQALALSPAAQAAAAVHLVASSSSPNLLTPTTRHSSFVSANPAAAFIPPVTSVLVPVSRSSSANAIKPPSALPLPHSATRPAFVMSQGSSSSSSSRMIMLHASVTSAGSESPEQARSSPPHIIPPSDDVPSNKSLRHKLHIPRNLPAATTSTAPALPRVVGHRGALYDELENTRDGFKRCADLGCDAVELDVFLLKDGTLVVFHGSGSDEHPGDLLEYTGIEGNILDLTYDQAKELRFDPNYEEFPCPPDKIRTGYIPTLEEVLIDLKPTNTHIKIELKGPGVVEPVLDLVDKLGMVDQCEFSSFEHDRIKRVRELRPQVGEDGRYIYKTGALFEDIPDDFVAQAVAAGASEVHLRYDYCTVERIRAIHAANMDSMCWFRGPIGMKSDVANKYLDVGNEDERCYQALIDTGVMQLCVNRPDVLIGLLKKQELPIIPVVADDDASMASSSASSS